MIHAVTNGTGLPEALQEKAFSLFPKVDAICLREKKLSSTELESKVRELLDRGIPPQKLIVHSHPDLVVSYSLQGVHFTEFDDRLSSFKQAYPGKKAGRSVHSAVSAKKAEAEGADYVYFGHIYTTSSKPGTPGRGLEMLQEVASAVSIPVVAIGGIHFKNLKTVLNAGASGAAMISAFFK